MNRREREELRQLAHLELLRRALAPLRTSQRGRARTLPPEPSAEDRALHATTTPAERARVSTLLCGAGFTRAEVERGEALLRGEALAGEPPDNDDGPADDVTRRRARQLIRGKR